MKVKCYRFQDINYTTATEDEQIGIFERYCKFLNSLDCNYKITINNKNKNMDELRDKVLIAEKNDGFNNYRRIYNDIIEEKIIEGRQGIEQERYLTITIERKNFEEAKAQFATLEATIHKAFIELGAEIVPLNGNERLKVLYDYYHLGDEGSFDFDIKKATGNYYGINQISKNVNIGNRKKLINGNGFVFGVPGSGKSFFCKMEMGSVFLSGDDEIIVIDPMNEYFDIAETYGGTVVNMSTYTDNYVNPLEMDVWSLDPNDSKGMVREKGEFMLGLCEQCIGDSLNSRQKSIIDRCVRKLYIDIARSKEKYIPVMSDFYDILMAQPEDEAKDIALSLELFVNGSLNIFNHQTNVDVDNRFTVYGIRDLGTELSPITMLVMMESIQNRIVENGKRGKATWLYIDEFHVLLNSEYSAKYLQQLWKKVRKQGGLCTGITQNVVDLLQNYTATTMLANSEFVALLKQANTDSSKMAEVIGVSEAQLRFVTNTASGMGLIKFGSVVIPFDNQISKDTDLYNTNIHEKIAMMKKEKLPEKVIERSGES